MNEVPIIYVPCFISNPQDAFDTLWKRLDWVRHENVPRREYYCNMFPEPYTYGSGKGVRTYQPQAWDPMIVAIMEKVMAHTGERYEVCFLNGYENNRDQLGWHADDSPEMDDKRHIAIVSLGYEREIWFCPQGEKSKVTKLHLHNGSLCLMKPGMQDTHFHRIPKSPVLAAQPRISLTFRGYVNGI